MIKISGGDFICQIDGKLPEKIGSCTILHNPRKADRGMVGYVEELTAFLSTYQSRAAT
jgi:hypothetical protein